VTHDETSPEFPEAGGAALERRLRAAIREGRLEPGRQLPSIRQLAKQHGLTYDVARGAIDRLKRDGLLLAQQGRGVSVAASTTDRHGRGTADSADPPTTPHQERTASGAPAVSGGSEVSPGRVASIENRQVVFLGRAREHYYGEVFGRVSEVLGPKGYTFTQLPPRSLPDPESPEAAALLARWRDNPPAAVVSRLGYWPPVQQLLETAEARGTRIVMLNRVPASHAHRWHSVLPNMGMIAEQVIDHLVKRGHQRIGLLTHGRRLDAQHLNNQRARNMRRTEYIVAFGEALRERGLRHALTIYRDRFGSVDGPAGRQFSHERLAQLADWLARPDRPTALIGSDFRVVTAIHAADRAGWQLRDEIDVVGINDTPWSWAFGFPSVNLDEPYVANEVARLIELDSAPAAHAVTTPVRLRPAPCSGPNASSQGDLELALVGVEDGDDFEVP